MHVSVTAADEGHRIKCMEAQLFTTLMCDMFATARHRVLSESAWSGGGKRAIYEESPRPAAVTGTPIQNHMGELFALLHWLNKDVFVNEATFLAEFGNLAAATEKTRQRLTTLLRPHILRRTKDDVLKTLPARHEVVVPVPLAPAQLEMYRMTLTRSYELLHATTSKAGAGGSGARSAGKASLVNVLMELRKAASHPYLITGAEESLVQRATLDLVRAAGAVSGAGSSEAQSTTSALALGPDDAYRLFVDVSGKLQLLRRLLPQLAMRGHRVLIFSGFKMALDVLEDFLRGLVMPPFPGADGEGAACPAGYRPGRPLLYSRIDGDTDLRTRQRIIDAYNRPGSKLFALLMTTRAGGQGLNLATADTVIIFDSDFNPHADRCAAAGCSGRGHDAL